MYYMGSATKMLKRLPPLKFAATACRKLDATTRQWLRYQQLRLAVKSTEPLQIIIGASGTTQAGWIATEQSQLDLLEPKTWARLFNKPAIKAINAEHVWEHLSPAEGLTAARTCFDYLKPGGRLRCAVPDGLHPSPTYIEYVRPGGVGEGSDDHRVLYTYESLSELFSKAGFQVELLEYFDRSGKFHACDWDPADGMITRSLRFDDRNRHQAYGYTSLIVDAIKPTEKI
jgi:predicted SAM-dependent methyltransferase